MGGDTGADSYLSRLNELGLLPKETYNKNELRHITVNYAISCLKGYNGSFEDWLKGISQNWREIANRK
jgi:hypothetical protein